MVENHWKTCSFLVKLVLLLHLAYSINNQKFEAEATQSELYHRMSNVEAQNRHHEKEISLLKMGKVEDRKEINHLRERVARLEGESSLTNLTSEQTGGRQKRPVRLLPPRLF